MKELNLLTGCEIFRFASNGLKYGISKIDGGMSYKTCNEKFFKYLGSGQFIEVKTYIETVGKFIDVENTLFNCFIHGRGENKKLYYENIIIINN